MFSLSDTRFSQAHNTLKKNRSLLPNWRPSCSNSAYWWLRASAIPTFAVQRYALFRYPPSIYALFSKTFWFWAFCVPRGNACQSSERPLVDIFGGGIQFTTSLFSFSSTRRYSPCCILYKGFQNIYRGNFLGLDQVSSELAHRANARLSNWHLFSWHMFLHAR